VSDNLNLAIALLADDNGVSQVSSATVDLDAVVEELLEGREIEDLVIDGGGGVDDELIG
jgi:riboflavin biosynthesis pyrimidine reductase